MVTSCPGDKVSAESVRVAEVPESAGPFTASPMSDSTSDSHEEAKLLSPIRMTNPFFTLLNRGSAQNRQEPKSPAYRTNWRSVACPSGRGSEKTAAPSKENQADRKCSRFSLSLRERAG